MNGDENHRLHVQGQDSAVRILPSDATLKVVGGPVASSPALGERDAVLTAGMQQEPCDGLKVVPIHPACHRSPPIGSKTRRHICPAPSSRSRRTTPTASRPPSLILAMSVVLIGRMVRCDLRERRIAQR
jgi:hypothetical protein